MSCKAWLQRALVYGGIAIFLSGCQDYGFEELPASTIKEKRWTQTISIATAVDILFVIDNSGSMVGEQKQLADSFRTFTDKLNENFGDDYRIAVITAGMESQGCPPCDPPAIPGSCMNETGENGRFQDRVCRNEGTIDYPDYVCHQDTNCRVVTDANKTCFYAEAQQEGMALVGINGCGYEKGLAPLRVALGELRDSYNSGFLRENATLAVVIISDEEDCGEVGDVSENIGSAMGNMCYFASKGIGPDGESVHPDDPNGRPYHLTPVDEYYNFLLDLKDGREGMVKFAAVVGVKDVENLSTTTIEYFWDTERERWDIENACVVNEPDCTGRYCFAKPGTRYVKLAQMFGIGQNGFVDTICQKDFAGTMEKLGTFVACPRVFMLSDPIRDPDLANILINGEGIPRYSCSIEGRLVPCAGTDAACSQGGTCVETWSYHQPSNPPDPQAPGGTITFGDHYDPCELFGEGDQVHIELVYVLP